MLPREEREERAIGKFLEYVNQTHDTSYKIMEWLDRAPRIGSKQNDPIPDCLCEDTKSGNKIVIERTILTGDQDLRLAQGAKMFLTDVSSQLTGKLPGVFHLYDWGINALGYKAKNRQQLIDQLCQEIQYIAYTLAEGEVATLSGPFPVKVRREEAARMTIKSALIYDIPECVSTKDKQQLDRQFQHVLSEAVKKFQHYTDISTILLLNIWETRLDYEYFRAEIFSGVNMADYQNITHIYLSDGDSEPPIYNLWSENK